MGGAGLDPTREAPQQVDNEFRTWTGKTVLAKWDWRGNYVVRVKVEWWNSTRKLGQKWWALHRYGYLNEFTSDRSAR